MKNISFLSENFLFLAVKISIYLNRRVFVMNNVYVFNTTILTNTYDLAMGLKCDG